VNESEKRRLIAFYIAGQAVYAVRYCGLTVESADIVPNDEDNRLGITNIADPPLEMTSDELKGHLEQALCMAIAGPVAEDMAEGVPASRLVDKDHRHWYEYHDGDGSVLDICNWLGLGWTNLESRPTFDLSGPVASYGARVRRELEAVWPAVEHVARLLLERDTIPGTLVHEAVANAPTAEQ
jgi:hypothetical protein